jgi:hypothetical protein
MTASRSASQISVASKCSSRRTQEYGVEFFFSIDAADALSLFCAGKEAATFHLQSSRGAVGVVDGVVSCLSCRRELDPEDACCFVLCDFAGDTQRFAGQRSVFLCEFFRVVEELHDAVRHACSWSMTVIRAAE